MTAKSFDLDQLLWPESTHHFINDYFEKRPFFLQREDPNFYDDLLSLADVESLVFMSGTAESYRKRWFGLVKGEHRPLEQELFDEHGIVPSRIVHHYHQGYTITVNVLQRRWLPISSLCRNLEESFNAFTAPLPFALMNANVYLTPPNAQGFLPHFDHHDVFVLQLEGTKNWTLYEELAKFPTEVSDKLSSKILGEPTSHVCLKPGDLLYIPRGYPHEASTSREHSMHLSIGIVTYTWAQLLTMITQQDERLRGSLPLMYPDDVPMMTTLEKQLDGLLQPLSSEENLTRVLKKFISLSLTNRFLLPSDYLDQINRLDSITLDTMLCKRHDQVCQIVRGATQLSIEFPGNAILFPKQIDAALRFMIEADEFSARSIPDMLHDDEKLALVHRLVGEGFLKTVPQPEPEAQ